MELGEKVVERYGRILERGMWGDFDQNTVCARA